MLVHVRVARSVALAAPPPLYATSLPAHPSPPLLLLLLLSQALELVRLHAPRLDALHALRLLPAAAPLPLLLSSLETL